MYLLDTHILLWISIAPQRLTARVRVALEEPDSLLHVSFASAWEYSAKRLKSPGQFTQSFAERMSSNWTVILNFINMQNLCHFCTAILLIGY
jgi:PIN domain nuclease of toxin-antitoxin system